VSVCACSQGPLLSLASNVLARLSRPLSCGRSPRARSEEWQTEDGQIRMLIQICRTNHIGIEWVECEPAKKEYS